MDIFSKDAFFSNLAKLQTLAEQGEQALSTIEGISQKSSKWYSLGWISEQMAKNGEVDRALQIAGKILDCSYQSDALSGIAKTIYFLDFERACSVAAIIENPETRWETFQTFCNWESSSEKYNSAAEIAHGIKFASYRARATLAAAHACNETGDINTLLNLVDTLWASVEEIEDHLSRTEILLGLSDLHKSKNDGVRAFKALRHAVSAASMIEDPETCLDALLRCGIAQVSLGDIDGAARTADDISFASEYVDWSLSGTADELRRQRI